MLILWGQHLHWILFFKHPSFLYNRNNYKISIKSFSFFLNRNINIILTYCYTGNPMSFTGCVILIINSFVLLVVLCFLWDINYETMNMNPITSWIYQLDITMFKAWKETVLVYTTYRPINMVYLFEWCDSKEIGQL